MLNRDVHPLDQPNGTFRYALNGAIETLKGDLGRISNELGHLDCAEIPGQILNYEALPENKYIVFVRADVDEIGLLDRCEYTTLLKDECLSFGDQVFSTYRVREGCKTVVYFTDFKNPVRAFEVENPPTSCDELDLFLGATPPGLDVTINPQGGQLQAGSYVFALRYLDENLNPTEWLTTSFPVNTLVPSTYGARTGLTGISPVSFEINVENIDTRYPYYQIAVIPYTSGTATPGQVLVSPKRRTGITSFTYSGNITGYTTTTVDDILIEGLRFTRAKYIAQLENRLILAGVAERQEDWCKYQRTVNEIQVGYHVVEEDMPGSPATDYERLGYTADEVYAAGIVFIFNDGTYSPVFHIPGKASTIYDKQLLTVTLAFPSSNQIRYTEVEHLGMQIGQTVERWKVQNTSQGSGQLAYHESTNTYPNTLDCDGELVWGDLAGQPIRHIRLPNRKTEPHVRNGKIRHLGLTFDNVNYPSDDIIGHFFVRGVRTESNKTILDKGVFFETWTTDGAVSFGEMKQDPKKLGEDAILEPDSVAAISPRILRGNSLFANYLTFDYSLNAFRNPESYQFAVDGAIGDVMDIEAEIRQYDQGSSAITFTNKVVESQVLLEPRNLQTVDGVNYRNGSFTNRMQLFKSSHDFMSQALLYGAIKQQTDPYSILEAIEYVPIGGLGVNQVMGGDTFITEMAVGNIMGSTGEEILRGGFFGNLQAQQAVYSSYIFGTYVESTVNFLPIEGESSCERYYISPERTDQNDFEFEFALDILTYLVTLVSDQDIDLERSLVAPCALVYDYADDFFISDRYNIYYPLINYNCCDECNGEFSNRIAYSQQSFQEEQEDNYRSFLGNNYRDLEGDTGHITQIKRWEDRLIIFTQENVWYLPPQMQERVNSEGIVSYVGTGSFFAIPPKKFNTSKNAGCKDPYSIIDTPAGIFFYDSKSGIPYMVARGLEPVNNGMSRWFLEAAKRGGNVHAGYDEEYNRVLLTSLGDDCGQSWTLSYSLDAKMWISFHDYTPLRYMSGKKELIVVSDKFYTANEGDYRVPFVIETVQKAQETRTWDFVEFYTEVEKDGVEETWSTFNEIWVYNNYQSTGILSPKTRNEQIGRDFMRQRVTTPIDLERDERNWRINGLRSIVTKEARIKVDSCDLTQSDILPAKFVGQQWFNREPLRSKYLVIRYFFSILENKKITFFYEKI